MASPREVPPVGDPTAERFGKDILNQFRLLLQESEFSPYRGSRSFFETALKERASVALPEFSDELTKTIELERSLKSQEAQRSKQTGIVTAILLAAVIVVIYFMVTI